MAEDYHIHGGVVEIVNCQGNVIMHGGVVERMNVQGDCKQYGGIIERRVIMAGPTAVAQQQTQPKERVIYKDRIVYKDRVVYRDRVITQNNPQQAIIIQKLEKENEQLRKTLKEKEETAPPDDVLVQRICSLRDTLDKERDEHAKEVAELKDRLDVACEINAQLRNRYEDDDRRSQEIADKHIDILATLMSLYPYTPDKDLEFEFGLPADRIRYAAAALGAIKSPEARHEAVDYLQRQHRELIQRRGGDQGNYASAKPVEKVGKYGRLIKSYDSIREVATDNGLCEDTIKGHCIRYHKAKKYFTKEGFTFRFKKQ